MKLILLIGAGSFIGGVFRYLISLTKSYHNPLNSNQTQTIYHAKFPAHPSRKIARFTRR
jgi:hypothetical protein